MDFCNAGRKKSFWLLVCWQRQTLRKTSWTTWRTVGGSVQRTAADPEAQRCRAYRWSLINLTFHNSVSISHDCLLV